jgi:glutathione synthase/RimK-type ligase-like ATP-grasp enzyme
MITLLRRRKLGKTSCDSISDNMFKKFNKDVLVLRNDYIEENTNYGIVIRWGCTSSINSDYVINEAKHIHLTSDKAGCRKLMQDNGISVPFSFFEHEDAIKFLSENRNSKIIGRQQFHHQGRKIQVSDSVEVLDHDSISDYWSEFIDKDREFRIFTFFGKVIMVAEKIPHDKSKVAWNNYGGGSTFVNVKWDSWPIKECVEAIKATNLIGIDFAGVDVMTKGNNCYILELNSAHSLTSDYRQSTFSKALNWLVDEIGKSGKKPDHFELGKVKTYKGVILPVIREREDQHD